jgi:AraC-like DNA-binding protein
MCGIVKGCILSGCSAAGVRPSFFPLSLRYNTGGVNIFLRSASFDAGGDRMDRTMYLLKYEYLKNSPVKNITFQSHDNYEIFYFHEGSGHYLIGDTIHVLTVGSLIIMHGMTLHTPFSQEPSLPYVRTLVNFDPAYFRMASEQLFGCKILEPFEMLGNGKVQLTDTEKAEFEAVLAIMNGLYNKQDAISYYRFHLALLDCLLLIYTYFQKPVAGTRGSLSGKAHHVQQVLYYLEQHYKEDLTLDRVAEHLHLNKHYLSRVFRQVTGMTLFEYLSIRRINQAKVLFLIEPDKTIADICYDIGFNNNSHFSRVFKQMVGMTPEHYRGKLKSQ